MKKSLSFLIVLIVSVGALFGCGPLVNTGGGVVDKTKTQLYVYNYNGGVGTDWLNNVIARFEEEYKETEFEPGSGKKGVEVIVDPQKYLGPDLTDKIPTSPNNVFFGERMHYYSWARDGLLMDISDMVTEDIEGESKSIEDKLDSSTQSMLKANNNKYYGLPHYEGFLGLTYDVQVFEDYKLYFKPDGNFINKLDDVRSNGPDGRTGIDEATGADYSKDDGLPATHEQFKKLCNEMTLRGVVPFVWTGMYNEYFTMVLNTFATAWLGKEEAELVYNFNGAAGQTATSVITGFNGNTPITEQKVIREDTGYLLWQQEAHYYAIDMANKIINSGTGRDWYYNKSIEPTFSHLHAQEEFIRGPLDSKPIGMLIDGNYWENESKDIQKKVENIYENSTNRRFAWMPVPGRYLTGNEGSTKLTLKDSLQSYAFINGNIKNENILKLSKMFLKYCYTDTSLENFTVETGMTRNYDYNLTAEQVSKMTHYGQSIWNYKKTADVVNVSTTSKLYLNNEEELVNKFYKTTVAGAPYDRPYHAFYLGKVSSKDFLNGMKRSSDAWQAANRAYYEYID